jgi:bifunctional DNA-binding transcriptional regulator/antitoxin component of YhaV-PrlF toxin-antitoxin module
VSIRKYYILTKNPLKEVSFGNAVIQKLRRVTLDANLLRTLDLAEGDSVEIVLLVESGEICLRKMATPVGSLKTTRGTS